MILYIKRNKSTIMMQDPNIYKETEKHRKGRNIHQGCVVFYSYHFNHYIIAFISNTTAYVAISNNWFNIKDGKIQKHSTENIELYVNDLIKIA